MLVFGFQDPHIDPNENDIKLWTSTSPPDHSSPRLDFDSIRYLLSYVAAQFCELIDEERSAYQQNVNEEKVVAWKRSVQGVREMCDVCETSLFNYHWTCMNCGFSVCLDCYKDRKKMHVRIWPSNSEDLTERDGYYWFLCTLTNQPHDIRELMLTQIITGDALEELNKRLHEICKRWNISQNCGCPLNRNCEAIETKSFAGECSSAVKTKKLEKKRRINPKESHVLYPHVKHEWLCEGRLLRLLDPLDSDESYQMFQDQWDMGQPVIVSNCTNNMNKSIWKPQYFLEKFGSRKNILIDCTTHHEVDNQSMGKFWEGFMGVQYRLRNRKTDKPMVLKLKDWPPSDDFAEILPVHFTDLMTSLPLPHYTARNGRFNLASHLPDHFVTPDLGPKMYSAYGQASHFREGSTNLHLDISDAVNVMVHVSVPEDVDKNKNSDDEEAIKSYNLSAVISAINDSRCDTATRRRFNDESYCISDKSKQKLPGAFWHIFDAKDADKIRDLLKFEEKRQGKPQESNSDPIHDQIYYLDKEMRDRLVKNYEVNGYSFIQFEGDAVFIPAGKRI